ncbi:c-type cytochrome [Belnapia sp. T6]|uniref:C-type cytochrome n=1 Tax=Belnapia mucosa TaxID=2804532 RepID=A0ABS1VD18_9PROT|nr:c-type cytochrome [Belnapia mucosa]MBL6458288.1 c-type cytochrome [Belnapia mucosa]
MRRWLALLLLLAGNAPAQELAGHGGPVRALAVLPEGVASAGFDAAVILWEGGRARRVMRWHAGAVQALLALPDGGLASAGEDGRIALWPPGGAEAPARVLEGHAAPVAALALGPDGVLGSAGWDGTLRLWDPDGTARVLEGHGAPVNGIAWDGAHWASAGYDGTVRRWGVQGGQVLAEFGLPQNALAALPDGGLAAGGADGAVRLIGADGAVRELAAGNRPVVALAVAPGRLAAASLGGSVTLWSLPEGRLLHTLEGPGLPVWSVAFDGARLWTGGQDRLVRGWDVASGTPLGPLAPVETAAPAEADATGARVFRACAACHALTEGGPPMAGPHLHGLFGRRMGSLPGYAYSLRLAQGDITWTPETVADLFTRGPDVVTPGTRMPVQRVGNPEEMAALIRFLAVATAAPPAR